MDWKKLEKWSEDIAEGNTDGARATSDLEGRSAYEKTISLLKNCEKIFIVNERSKIWWDEELDQQAMNVRRLGRGMSRAQRDTKHQQWGTYRK